ncbi:unnamed protein product, partial [Nesidiocoris tenuis]
NRPLDFFRTKRKQILRNEADVRIDVASWKITAVPTIQEIPLEIGGHFGLCPYHLLARLLHKFQSSCSTPTNNTRTIRTRARTGTRQSKMKGIPLPKSVSEGTGIAAGRFYQSLPRCHIINLEGVEFKLKLIIFSCFRLPLSKMPLSPSNFECDVQQTVSAKWLYVPQILEYLIEKIEYRWDPCFPWRQRGLSHHHCGSSRI